MALKFSHVLIFIILWLSLLFLLFREFYNFKYSNIINTTKQISTVGTAAYSSWSSSSSQYYSSSHHHPLISRKVLASNFDFTPFLNHHHHQQKEKHHNNNKASPVKQQEQQSEPAAADEDDQTEIDPRYGVQKRRVPTGPNPLHH